MWDTSLIDGPLADPSDTAGYRLNVAPTVVCDAIEPYRVTPTKKLRQFFGAPTHRFVFPDEATARGLLAEYWIEDEA